MTGSGDYLYGCRHNDKQCWAGACRGRTNVKFCASVEFVKNCADVRYAGGQTGIVPASDSVSSIPMERCFPAAGEEKKTGDRDRILET